MNINRTVVGLCISSVLISTEAMSSTLFFKHSNEEKTTVLSQTSNHKSSNQIGLDWDILGSQKFQLGLSRETIWNEINDDVGFTKDLYRYHLRYKDVLFNTVFDQKLSYIQDRPKRHEGDGESIESRTIISKNTTFTDWYKLFTKVDYKFKRTDQMKFDTEVKREYDDEKLIAELRNNFRLNKRNNLTVGYLAHYESKDVIPTADSFRWKSRGILKTQVAHSVGNQENGLFKIYARYERLLSGKEQMASYEVHSIEGSKYMLELDYSAPAFKFRLRPYWQRTTTDIVDLDKTTKQTRYGLRVNYKLSDEFKLIGNIYEQSTDIERGNNLDPLLLDKQFMELKLNYTF